MCSSANNNNNNNNKMTTTPKDVLLYIPNLIGYARVIFTAASFILMICSPSQWLLAILLYIASFVGDLIDGVAARLLNQSSTFGGLLDMITDRCSTAGLLFILSGCYGMGETLSSQMNRLTFLFLILLDISSHWCQMYSTASRQQHHKSSAANIDRFFLVRWYYDNYYFFGYCCVGTEFCYIILYALAHVTQDNDVVLGYILMFCAPACVIKQVVNVSQLCAACYAVAKEDAAAVLKHS